MFIAYLLTTIVTMLGIAGVALGDLMRAESVLATSAEVGVPWIGVSAAAGLVLFFIGAIAVHIRARVFHDIAVPACFLALAVGTLVLSVTN